MPVLRYMYIVALATWVGGTVITGAVVAPTVFGVLQAWDPAMGRVLAGKVFGGVLGRVELIAYGAGAVMIVALALQRVIGPRPASVGIRAGLIAIMLGLTAYMGFVITPRIDALQQSVSGPMNRLPADDARRVDFDRLHGLSSTLFTLAGVGGLILLLWEARERA
jgi:uncharacterized protein DUF4149